MPGKGVGGGGGDVEASIWLIHNLISCFQIDFYIRVLYFYFPFFSQMSAVIVQERKFCCIWFRFTFQSQLTHFCMLNFSASVEYCGPFIYSTLNKQHLETWSRVCGYCAYGLFLCFRSLWNIPKNARELGMGPGQFPSGVNGLIWTKVLFIQEVSGVYTFWF